MILLWHSAATEVAFRCSERNYETILVILICCCYQHIFYPVSSIFKVPDYRDHTCHTCNSVYSWYAKSGTLTHLQATYTKQHTGKSWDGTLDTCYHSYHMVIYRIKQGSFLLQQELRESPFSGDSVG